MQRIYMDSSTPMYESGKWTWNEESQKLQFHEHCDLEHANERYMDTNGFQFLRAINQHEEVVFRQVFTRSETTYDSETVTIDDVRDLVLFMMPKEFISHKFINFMHKPAVNRLIRALSLYFEHFLRMVEFILVRRDEVSGNMAQVQSEQTNEMKRIYSSYLSQYRMLAARNYSVIIKGEGSMKKYYHTKEVVNISSKIKDCFFHESFLAVCTQIIWILMHRRAYYIIEMEMNRMFRSEHFMMNRSQYPKFSPVERSLLYGRQNKIVNARKQISPMIQELMHLAHEDQPILWIGVRKYRGSDERIAELELEYMVPAAQLSMIDVSRGILGHPKKLYNTLLALDWPSVRYAKFTATYDPYFIVRQPCLRIPNINELTVRKHASNYEHFFHIFRVYEKASNETLMNWVNREKIISFYKTGGALYNITNRCEQMLMPEGEREVEKTVQTYYQVTSKKRKKPTMNVQEKGGDEEQQPIAMFDTIDEDRFYKL